MYYTLIINDKEVHSKDCIYRLDNEELHKISIIGVFYASDDYEYLKNLLEVPIDIQLVGFEDEVKFAELKYVVLDNVEYHLSEDDVNFYGTFKVYAEDTEKLRER